MFTFIIHAVVSVFAVMNPIGNVPIFLSLTDGYEEAERRNTALRSVAISFILLTIFLILGHYIFNLFGITISAFRVAGGILIFGIAYKLLHGSPSHMHKLHDDEHKESIEKEDISVTPLAIPIIAGPGTIATVMTLAAGGRMWMSSVDVLVSFTLVLGITYFVFRFSSWISSKMGKTEMNIVTRLMGLILAIISVQMVAEGLLGLFPGLS